MRREGLLKRSEGHCLRYLLLLECDGDSRCIPSACAWVLYSSLSLSLILLSLSLIVFPQIHLLLQFLGIADVTILSKVSASHLMTIPPTQRRGDRNLKNNFKRVESSYEEVSLSW